MTARYERSRDLPPLLPLWPAELADMSPAGRMRVIGLLRRALRAERIRGIGGHWTYDLARHRGLVIALREEITGLQSIRLRPQR